MQYAQKCNFVSTLKLIRVALPVETYTFCRYFALTPNQFTREGYTFTGWNTEPGGRAAPYTDGQIFDPWLMAGSLDKIYAQWQINTYTIAYMPGAHGAFAPDVHENAAYGSATPAFAGQTDTTGQTDRMGLPDGEIGYNFTGWSPEVSSTVIGESTHMASRGRHRRRGRPPNGEISRALTEEEGVGSVSIGEQKFHCPQGGSAARCGSWLTILYRLLGIKKPPYWGGEWFDYLQCLAEASIVDDASSMGAANNPIFVALMLLARLGAV